MFTFVRKINDKLIDFALNNESAMQVSKFLVSEVINYLVMSFNDIKRLTPAFDKLDDKHFVFLLEHHLYLLQTNLFDQLYLDQCH